MTFEKVRDAIVETISCEESEVTMEASLVDDIGLDSLDAVELNISLEEAFGVSIRADEMGNMKTVGEIVAFLDAQQA